MALLPLTGKGKLIERILTYLWGRITVRLVSSFVGLDQAMAFEHSLALVLLVFKNLVSGREDRSNHLRLSKNLSVT